MRTRLSIQSLEVFAAVARTRSLRAAAQETGLSTSSVFHHVGRCEQELGTVLIDRSRRPLRLTSPGQNFLIRVEEGLLQIRLAFSDTATGGIATTRTLRLALIDEFEGRVGPELALRLSAIAPRASLAIRTLSSREALDHLIRREVDFALVAESGTAPDALTARPLLRDPYAMAVPQEDEIDPAAHVRGEGLPLIRYAPRHLLGQQIAAQLRRSGVASGWRYEFDDTASILAMVAAGRGWAVTTPLAWERVWRAHDRVRLQPLPVPAFSRRLTLYGRADSSDEIAELIASTVRELMHVFCIAPVVARFDWLQGEFRLEDVTA